MTELRKIEEVEIGPEALRGMLVLPPSARGLVIFAHGGGSGRFSPRNNHVGEGLRAHRLGTLLLDLLMPEEEIDRRLAFDVELLAHRLLTATFWVQRESSIPQLPVCYLGASTGAAAALLAAAQPGASVSAIFSRGGRPDLAADALPHVRAPTLFLFGSLDRVVLELNRQAYERMTCARELSVIPGAGHLFDEAGTLDELVAHAARWFMQACEQRSPTMAAAQ
ncbi:MAG: alpha/beta hydrolase [Alphaproteobacteria bacterium]|nr:alpha/beta hydrolase [Alphaproteobacteria bacterium]MBM4437550.1 alpha/beta hydrolase [Actinomycetota bacterium]